MDWGVLAVFVFSAIIYWMINGFVDRICEKIGSVGDRISDIESELREIRSDLGSIYGEVQLNKKLSSASAILKRLDSIESAITNLDL